MSETVETPAPAKIRRLRDNIEKVFYGKPAVVSQLLVGLLAEGHILIEDVPGVGKTLLAMSLARSIGVDFSRIQLTPDLLPSDITGVSVYSAASEEFVFKRGPVFANIVLADEINRATPRTQSALLEAMNERQVTADGRTIPLSPPFMVLATQNPFEFEGTYFLPESQLDRFLIRLSVGYPPREEEIRVLRDRPAQTRLGTLEPVMTGQEVISLQDAVNDVRIDDGIMQYVMDLVQATRDDDRLEVGVSPRGGAALARASKATAMLDERDYVVPDDIKALFVSVCAHRVVGKSYLRDGRGVPDEQIMLDVLDRVPAPQ